MALVAQSPRPVSSGVAANERHLGRSRSRESARHHRPAPAVGQGWVPSARAKCQTPACHTVLCLGHCRAGRRPAAARSLRIAVKAQRADQGTDRAKEEGAARARRAVPGGHWGKLLLSPAVTTLEPSVGGPSLPDDAHSGCRDTGSPTSLLGLKVGAHPDCQVPRPPQAQVEKSRSRGSSSSSAKAHCHPSNSPGGQRGLTSPPQAHCPQTLNPRHRRQRRPQ